MYNEYDLNKIEPFTIGYRDGIFECLLQIKNLLEEPIKANDLLIFIKAALKDMDVFINYGSKCILNYTEWDRKYTKDGKLKSSTPIAGKLYKPGTDFINTAKGLRSKDEVYKLVVETMELINKEKEEKYKALERKIKELEKNY